MPAGRWRALRASGCRQWDMMHAGRGAAAKVGGEEGGISNKIERRNSSTTMGINEKKYCMIGGLGITWGGRADTPHVSGTTQTCPKSGG
jgi:hypothetical protein